MVFCTVLLRTGKQQKAVLDCGYGIVSFKNAQDLRDVAKQVPLDRLLIETDSPYLAPYHIVVKRMNQICTLCSESTK